MYRVDGDILRIVMSSIIRWRSGVVGFVMVGSNQEVAGATILSTWLLTVGQRLARP
jgi:hypothetical protein